MRLGTEVLPSVFLLQETEMEVSYQQLSPCDPHTAAAAAAPPGKLSQTQHLRSHPRPAESEHVRVGPRKHWVPIASQVWKGAYITWLSGVFNKGWLGNTLELCRTVGNSAFRKWVRMFKLGQTSSSNLDGLHMRSAKCFQLAKHILKRASWVFSSLTRWKGCRRKL